MVTLPVLLLRAALVAEDDDAAAGDIVARLPAVGNCRTASTYDADRAGMARATRPTDPFFAGVIIASLFASVASFVCFYVRHETLAYPDAQSHLMIARRLFDSPTPGFGQLGSLWLPLPHLLMVPFIWNDQLFYSGVAGSVVSMACFVLTSAWLYKLTALISGDRGAAVIASAVFILNPNVLYLQATPMSELPHYLFITAVIYFLAAWSHSPERLGYLILSGAALVLESLTRYEGWPLIPIAVAVVVWVCLKERFGRHKTEAFVWYFGVIACVGVVVWILWNQVIFGDPLTFQHGEYAKPSNWVGSTDRAVGNIGVSAQSYAIAILDTVGVAALAVGALGLARYLRSTRLRPASLAPLALLFPLPFFVLALYTGQRPLHVPQLSGDAYNLRFGLIMVLPTALFAGYLTRTSPYAKGAVLAVVALGAGFSAFEGVATLNEPQAFQRQPQAALEREAGSWLKANYRGGMVLIESYGNEQLEFESHISLGELLYEGSFRRWQPALRDPAAYVDWVVMDRGGARPDKVWTTVRGEPEFSRQYHRTFSNGAIEIYEKNRVGSARDQVAAP